MTITRMTSGAVAALLCLNLSTSALNTDEELDAMLQSSVQLDAAGKASESQALHDQAREAIRQRLARDSSATTALTRLDQLDKLIEDGVRAKKALFQSLHDKAASGDSSGVLKLRAMLHQRYPEETVPSVTELLKEAAPKPIAPPTSVVDSCAQPHRPHGCPELSRPKETPSKASKEVCPAGPPQPLFLKPSPEQEVPVVDSVLLVQVRILAPCPLRSLELRRDSISLRTFDLPLGKTGAFEFSDAVNVSPEVRGVQFVACDTFGTCSQSNLRMKLRHRVPPWIPWTSGGLIILGLATGILALFRRPPNGAASKEGNLARGLQLRSAPSRPTSDGEQVDVQECLRMVIAEAEKGLARGPRLVIRMNTAIPAIEASAGSLGSALTNLLRLPIARAGIRGTVLVATGRGPVNMEVVLEDNGPDIEEPALRTLLDPGTPKNRERQGLDKDLSDAALIIAQLRGHLAAEPRIDGGLRLRIRLPLPSATGPRATSLLK